MLAQNFKTPTDLGISDVEFEALVKVLGMLERQEVDFAPVDDNLSNKVGDQCGWLSWEGHKHRVPIAFNMNWVLGESECGTTACMMGWAKYLSGDFTLFSAPVPDAVKELFIYHTPTPSTDAKWSATPSQAAIALRSFLTTGRANWAEALAE